MALADFTITVEHDALKVPREVRVIVYRDVRAMHERGVFDER